MSAPLSVVSEIWNVVALLRDRPGAKEEHKAAFRALVTTLGVSPVELAATSEGLAYQGILAPEEATEAAALARQMLRHGIGEIALPEGTGAAPLLSLLRALAAPAGTYRHIQEFITAVGEPGASQFRLAAALASSGPVVSALGSTDASTAPPPREVPRMVLEQQRRIVVPREQAEQHPVGKPVRTPLPGPFQLEEPSVLSDGAGLLDAVLGRWAQPHDVPAPDAGLLLLFGDRECGLRLDDGKLRRLELLGRHRAGRREFSQRPKPDRLSAVLQ